MPGAGTTRVRPRVSRPCLFPLLALVLPLFAGAGVHAEFDPVVEAAQRKLAENGYDPGPIDGVMGSRTRDEIRQFQRSVGLLDTGQLDEATRAALGVEPHTAGRPEPTAGTEDPPEAVALRDVPAPDMETQEADARRNGPEPEAGTAAPAAAPRAVPPPERATGQRLSFALLGWHPPQTGAEALVRLNESGSGQELKRGADVLVVPNGEFVFVLESGERIPGFDCDPGAGALSIEFVFGPDGPFIFTPKGAGGYCQVGFGIALEVGRALEMMQADWGSTTYPRGTVRVTEQGLEFAR